MADNLLIITGSGQGIVATDQNPGGSQEHYQIVKLSGGPLDTFNLITATAAAASAQASDPALVVTPSPNAAIMIAGARQTSGSALLAASVSGYDYLRVALEPTEIFTDPFDTPIDTVNRWALTGSVLPSVTNGVLTVSPGVTTLSSRTGIKSIPSFAPNGSNYMHMVAIVKFESGGTPFTNTHRFIGVGTEPASTTAVAPLTDAIGFEIDVSGSVSCSVWAGGAKSANSATIPTAVRTALFDGNFHRLAITFRADRKFFYIDDMNVPVVTILLTASNVQALPLLAHTVINLAAASGVPIFSVSHWALGDTGRNTTQISDGAFPFRVAGVPTNSNALSVITGANNANRSNIVLAITTISGSVADTMFSLMTRSTNGAAVGTGIASVSASAGKILRITGGSLILRNSAAVQTSAIVTLRHALTGAITTASPVAYLLGVSVPVATVNSSNGIPFIISDGLEISGSMTVGASNMSSATSALLALTLNGYEY
jgi:hypothetical protein